MSPAELQDRRAVFVAKQVGIAAELSNGVRHFLENDAAPALDGIAKFDARVAADMLATDEGATS